MSKGSYLMEEVADFCCVDFATVNYLIKHGKLKAHKTAEGYLRINHRDLEKFMERYIPKELNESGITDADTIPHINEDYISYTDEDNDQDILSYIKNLRFKEVAVKSCKK